MAVGCAGGLRNHGSINYVKLKTCQVGMLIVTGI
jgi:hypothetical protein